MVVERLASPPFGAWSAAEAETAVEEVGEVRSTTSAEGVAANVGAATSALRATADVPAAGKLALTSKTSPVGARSFTEYPRLGSSGTLP
jgi:hypothetical protein